MIVAFYYVIKLIVKRVIVAIIYINDREAHRLVDADLDECLSHTN